MNDAVERMLVRYACTTPKDFENALKEIIQEIALLGLSRSDFFSHAAFYGGTALRVFYGLPRYSEDLDFSLESRDASFDIARYFPCVEEELSAYKFHMSVKKKEKSQKSAIQSAFIKGNTVQNILEITADPFSVSRIHRDVVIRIKMEIVTDPPEGACFQRAGGLNPSPYRVRLYDEPSMFAGKIHAVLCRDFRNHVKGRDFFDYIWYLQRGVGVNLYHLQKRMEQSGKWNPETLLTLSGLKELLEARFRDVDYDQARADVTRFLNRGDRSNLSLWDSDFFTDLTARYLRSDDAADHCPASPEPSLR